LKTIVCIGTGPSLTLEQIQTARDKGFTLFGCNLTYKIVPDLELLYGCNLGFWEHHWGSDLEKHGAEKWTTNRDAADRFNLNWIAEKNSLGLSTDPDVIHHGHGSGYSLVSMAYRAGADRIILLGYDLKYAPDYNGVAHHIGSTPRHYFGEYPAALQHWPSVKVSGGVHVELLDYYRSIAQQGLVEIVNCTPDSAIDCFERKTIDAVR